VKSVEEAMTKFITPEVLDENNLYNCDACGNKCRAVKGTRLKRVPYFLIMQLKRFDFDFATMNRVKLCDRVSFPYVLDMADFVEGGKIDKEVMAKATGKKLEDLMKMTDKKEEKEQLEEVQQSEDDNMTDDVPSSSSSASAPAPATLAAEDPEKDILKEAPPKEEEPVDTVGDKKNDLIYDLYAILIHSGGANGGHYYAYIKDYRSGKWFEFNDSSVSAISETDIQNVFGKESKQSSYGGYGYGGYYSNNSYGTTAYMLLYRKVDPEKNILPPTDEEVPHALREYMEKENAAELERKRLEKLERETVHLTITYNNEKKKFDRHQSVTIAQLKADFIKEFGLEAEPGDVRLFSYDSYFKKKTLLEEKDTIEFSGINQWNKDLIAVVKKAGEEWEDENPNLITLHIFYEQVAGDDAHPVTIDMEFASFDLKIDKLNTIQELRKNVAEKTGIDADHLRLMKKSSNSWDTCDTFKDDKDTLSYSYIEDGKKIYAERCENPLEPATATTSRVFQFLELKKNMAKYRINVDGQNSFDVVFDSRRPLKEFCALISEKCGIPADKMVIKYGYWKSVAKDLDMSVKHNIPFASDEIYVEEGIMGSYNVELLLWRPELNKVESLFRIRIIESESFGDFLSRAVPKYLDFVADKPDYPRGKDSTFYGVRAYPYKDEFPRGFYDPQAIVKTVVSYMSEDKKFVLDVLSEPIQYPEPEDILRVFCYEWHPSTNTVDQIADELVVRKKAPINDIRRSLVSLHQRKLQQIKEAKPEERKDDQPVVEANDQCEATGKDEHSPSEASESQEETWEYRAEDVCIIVLDNRGDIRAPLVRTMYEAVDAAPSWEQSEKISLDDIKNRYVTDGYSIAFWSKAEPKKELTEEEKAALNNSNSSSSYSTTYPTYSYSHSSTTSSYWSRKEKGIKIHVDEESDDDDDDDDDAKSPKNPEEEPSTQA